MPPRGRVPAKGRLVTTPLTARQRISGLDPISVHAGVFIKNMNGEGLMMRSARYTSNGSADELTRNRWLGTN